MIIVSQLHLSAILFIIGTNLIKCQSRHDVAANLYKKRPVTQNLF